MYTFNQAEAEKPFIVACTTKQPRRPLMFLSRGKEGRQLMILHEISKEGTVWIPVPFDLVPMIEEVDPPVIQLDLRFVHVFRRTTYTSTSKGTEETRCHIREMLDSLPAAKELSGSMK